MYYHSFKQIRVHKRSKAELVEAGSIKLKRIYHICLFLIVTDCVKCTIIQLKPQFARNNTAKQLLFRYIKIAMLILNLMNLTMKYLLKLKHFQASNNLILQNFNK